MHKPESVLEKRTLKVLWDFEIQTDHLILARRSDKKKKIITPADHREELKESEKERWLSRPCKRAKKLWKMKVTVIPFVTGFLWTIPKGLINRLVDLVIRGRVETIQTTTILRSARTPRRVLETWRDLVSLKLQRKTISKRWFEKLSEKS